MPDPVDYPFQAGEFLMPRLLQDLGSCKTLPLKISHVKHQDELRAVVLVFLNPGYVRQADGGALEGA